MGDLDQSQNFELLGTNLVTILLEVLEDVVECLIHNWRAAHPYLLNLLDFELLKLTFDPLGVPAGRIDLFLAESGIQLECNESRTVAVGVEGLAKFKTNRGLARWETHVEDEPEMVLIEPVR